MTADFKTKILGIPVLDLHGEPTVREVDLGMRLGMTPPTTIRQIIESNRAELEQYGVLHRVRAAQPTPDGGYRDITEYHLTEPQALCLCLLARVPQTDDVRRMLITAFIAWHRRRDNSARQPDGLEGVIVGPCSFPHLLPGNTRFDWQGHSIDTDLSRLDRSRDVVALLPDGRIDIVRLISPPHGIGGRQGITRRYLDPDNDEASPVMVIILGQIGSRVPFAVGSAV